MGKELYESREEARQVFDEISEATGQDVRHLCFDMPEDELRETQNAQLALFTVGLASYRSVRDFHPELQIDGMAGHSVGEYAALAAAGVLPLGAAARLVRARGQIMADAGREAPGTMAAVLGLEREALEQVCEETDGVVVVANDNCPGQLVISGGVDAVKRASELASSKGAKRVLPLNVSGAFHSPLMEGPAARMVEALEQESFQLGDATVYANVTAEPALDAERWPKMLEDQLRSPVRWTETIQNMIRDGYETFIECGPGEVLSGLIRRVSKEVKTVSVGDPSGLEKLGQALS